MHYYVRYFFIISLSIQPAFATTIEHKTQESKQVVVAWDFHDVLVSTSWLDVIRKCIRLVQNEPHKWLLIKSIPGILYDSYNAKKMETNLDDFLVMLTKNYPVLEKHNSQLFELINTKKKNEDSIAVLQTLNTAGVVNVLASNIGPAALAKMHSEFPGIFDQFRLEYIPHDNRQKIAKPDPEYFVGLRTKLHATLAVDPHTPIVFIDDKVANINGAVLAGVNIQPILFKNSAQLKRDLTTMGIINPTTKELYV